MSDQEKNLDKFPLAKQNYILLAIGFAIIILGFLMMSGGKNPDPTTFEPDVIFSFRRIILAPVWVVGGFIFEIFAIMKKTD